MSAFNKQVGGDHYKKYAIQLNEFSFKNGLNPMQANALKYICRYKDKDGERDLDKAIHVIEMLKEMEYGANHATPMTLNKDNFFMVIGAGRCGSTSLANWLGAHEGCTSSKPKEPTFFECEYPHGLDFYIEKYFKNGLSQMNGDFRTRNMAIPYVPERVKAMFGTDIPIIVLLRNPIRRAISDWAIFRAMRPGRENLSLIDAMKKNMDEFDPDFFACEENACAGVDAKGGTYRRVYLELGMYAHHLRAWEEFENILCVDAHEMFASDVTKDAILDHIGIDRPGVRIPFPRDNAASFSISEPLLNEAHNMIRDWNLYGDDAKELSELLGFDFNRIWNIR